MTLRDRLVERIRGRGPMTFADFMDAALYDPQDGYYTTKASIGFDGADFLTSSELGPAFGRALARAAVDGWTGIGKPASWDIVEAGAGRGILMRDLLDALGKERAEAARSARPAIVEVYPADHGWCVPGSQPYNQAAAERAWAELLRLYRTTLV